MTDGGSAGTAGAGFRAEPEPTSCVHCRVEIREINYALGREWRHSPYPHHTRDAYRFCEETVATPPENGAPR